MRVTYPVQPAADPLAVALGYKNWNLNPGILVGGNFTPTSQTIYAGAVYLPPGTVVTGCAFQVSVVAQGNKPTGLYVGLASPSKMVAQSTDVSGNSGVPFASTGITQVAFSATYTTNAVDSPTGLYYVVFLQNGSYGTANPQFSRGLSLTGSGNALTGANPPQATLGTGQATLATNGTAITLTAATPNTWAAVY